jgi:hypothetical protein
VWLWPRPELRVVPLLLLCTQAPRSAQFCRVPERVDVGYNNLQKRWWCHCTVSTGTARKLVQTNKSRSYRIIHQTSSVSTWTVTPGNDMCVVSRYPTCLAYLTGELIPTHHDSHRNLTANSSDTGGRGKGLCLGPSPRFIGAYTQ